MVMDATRQGVVGKLVAWGAVTTVVLALLGGAFNAALQISNLSESLDRNCRILVQLDQDLRIHILAEARRNPDGAHDALGILDAFPKASC